MYSFLSVPSFIISPSSLLIPPSFSLHSWIEVKGRPFFSGWISSQLASLDYRSGSSPSLCAGRKSGSETRARSPRRVWFWRECKHIRWKVSIIRWWVKSLHKFSCCCCCCCWCCCCWSGVELKGPPKPNRASCNPFPLGLLANAIYFIFFFFFLPKSLSCCCRFEKASFSLPPVCVDAPVASLPTANGVGVSHVIRVWQF